MYAPIAFCENLHMYMRVLLCKENEFGKSNASAKQARREGILIYMSCTSDGGNTHHLLPACQAIPHLQHYISTTGTTDRTNSAMVVSMARMVPSSTGSGVGMDSYFTAGFLVVEVTVAGLELVEVVIWESLKKG
ncbi:hypothetical protein D9758_013317 [Tetrapyrgos nigripes]|uniref:Uncharacterized protein n=1 Tax=Tetrapyrgos nigripes TaxID=182062 RepID=A0A8H5CDI1_9AGAR|nr:hypothetical protein D9758_013317 [Tetrapyrgos nigripes]